MTSSYYSRYPLLHTDLNLDHDLQPTTPFTLKSHQVASSSSSSSSHGLDYPPIIIKTNQDEGSHYFQGLNYPFRKQEEAHANASHDGARESPTVMKQGSYGRIKLSIGKKDEVKGNRGINEDASSAKLMSSRIRMMRKMVGSDQLGGEVREDHKDLPTSPFQRDDNDDDNNNKNSIRVCADCNTTKTPLWRSGPKGPKSLCNACGIRQRKARRAMMAAAGENGRVLAAKINNNPAALKTKLQKNVKKASESHLPLKKSCEFTSSGRARKKLSCFEDLFIILSKNSTYQQVFPQDEKEAAILLMALSYGLVQG